jgi:hypothetical protein
MNKSEDRLVPLSTIALLAGTESKKKANKPDGEMDSDGV